MPHAALWVVQHLTAPDRRVIFERVSMPHAALWVVQPDKKSNIKYLLHCFNAARGFVGGAASSLSALVPLRGKRPFGKSPEI